MSRRPNLEALNEMLTKQGEFSLRVRQNVRENEARLTGMPVPYDQDPKELIKWGKEYGLATVMEVTETVDMLKWKPHREEHHFSQLDRDGVGEELIDVLNYTMAQLSMWGFSAADVYQMWEDKYRVLEQRQYQEKDSPLRSGDNVIVVDLDGCVADFRAGLLNFLKEEGQVDPELIDQGLDLNMDTEFNMNPLTYRQLKWRFEEEGGYRYLPLMPGAEALISELRKHGRIVFITSRTVPLKRIYRDTLVWIQTHFPDLDFVLYVDDRKAEKIAISKCNVLLCVEDDPKHAKRFISAGFNVLMPVHAYNRTFREKYEDVSGFWMSDLKYMADSAQAILSMEATEL